MEELDELQRRYALAKRHMTHIPPIVMADVSG
jgi:hypothetical protein